MEGLLTCCYFIELMGVLSTEVVKPIGAHHAQQGFEIRD